MLFAKIAAGIAVFVAPFWATAGARGAMLLLAAVAILFVHSRNGQLKYLLPREKTLAVAVAIWLISASAWSLLGPSPMESFSVVKRDMFTSVLAFFVFYALTRTRDDLMRWISILNAGLVILTGMVILDPNDPRAFGPAREYVDVGWLTAWLVMVAPLMAVLMFPPRSQRRSAMILLIVGMACLLWLAWLSGNRMVWICFAATVAISAAIASRDRTTVPDRKRSYFIVAGLFALIGLLMVASMQFRAEAEAPGGAGSVAFMLHDSRMQLWRVAWDMICERPFFGYGYSNPEFPEVFAAHFAPGWRHLFRHAHNVVLNYMLQMGLVGAAAILFLFAALGRTFVKRVHAGGLSRLAGYCGIALVVAVMLRNSTDDFFTRHGVQFFAAFAGMLLGLATHRPPLSAGPTKSGG